MIAVLGLSKDSSILEIAYVITQQPKQYKKYVLTNQRTQRNEEK